MDTESVAGEFCSQTGFFGHKLIACCFHFLLCGMQGVQHVVESRGIGVDVHLPSVALKAFVGGSHGHCWVEFRYLLHHLQFSVSTCRWVKARSDWSESSWSKRHMLTRADLRDSDRHCRYVRRPLTMPTQEYLVSRRFVLTSLLYLACHGRGARQPKAVALLTELFVASIGQVPKGVCLTTMVPTAGVEHTSVELCANLADSRTNIVVAGSGKVLRAFGVEEQSERAGPIVKVLLMKPKTKGFRSQPSLCLCWGWQVWSTIGSLGLGSK